jgi:hypothetical protein
LSKQGKRREAQDRFHTDLLLLHQGFDTADLKDAKGVARRAGMSGERSGAWV